MNNEQTEKAILACILKEGDLINKVAEVGILPKDFNCPDCKTLITQMMEESTKGNQPIYENMMVFENVNLHFLNEVDEMVETAMVFQTVLDRFIKNKKQLKMTILLKELTEGIERGLINEDDVVSKINDNSSFSFNSSKATSAADEIKKLLELSNKDPEEIERQTRKFTHGHRFLDEKLGMIHQTEYQVIGARPSTGKTSRALEIAVANAKLGYNVLFFSFETDSDDLTETMLLQQTKHRYEDILKDPNAKMAWEDAHKNDFYNNLHIISTPCTVEAIEGKARAFYAIGKCDMVVIDYIQLVIPTNKKDFREQQIAHISRRFRLLTIDLKVPVVSLAQLNRESEKAEREPKMSDLRESGSIEQDATRIVMIHRPAERFDKSGQQGAAYSGSDFHTKLIQTKFKKGQKDVGVQTVFEGKEQSFYEYSAY